MTDYPRELKILRKALDRAVWEDKDAVSDAQHAELVQLAISLSKRELYPETEQP
jgi:hypothetical protein